MLNAAYKIGAKAMKRCLTPMDYLPSAIRLTSFQERTSIRLQPLEMSMCLSNLTPLRRLT